MNDSDFELALDQSLHQMADGLSVEECLARFPQYADELHPLLEAAGHAATGLRAGEPLPPPNLARGRARVLQAARAPQTRPGVLILRWAAAFAFVMVLVFGVASASAQSIPGDVLYPVKRAIEAAQLALTGNLNARLRLEAEHNARRQSEVRELIRLKREAIVEFEGPVESATGDELVVAGVRIRGANAVTVGDRVRVNVRTTAEGSVVLEALTPIVVVSPADRSTPTFTATQPPSHTPTDAATATRSRPSKTASPAPSVTPMHTAAHTAPPTRVPTDIRLTATPERATPTPEQRATEPPPTPTSGRGRP
ncbi:MAG: DUF5667 domain-containing protein [Anaerolineales bacterium]